MLPQKRKTTQTRMNHPWSDSADGNVIQSFTNEVLLVIEYCLFLLHTSSENLFGPTSPSQGVQGSLPQQERVRKQMRNQDAEVVMKEELSTPPLRCGGGRQQGRGAAEVILMDGERRAHQAGEQAPRDRWSMPSSIFPAVHCPNNLLVLCTGSCLSGGGKYGLAEIGSYTLVGS